MWPGEKPGHWLSMLLVGLAFALVLAAAVPTRPTRTQAEAFAEARAEVQVTAAMNVFLWVLLVGLVLTIVLSYWA